MYRNIDNLSVLCYYCSNTVINGGLLTALSVFMEFEPEFLSEVVKETLRSLEYTTLMWRPAGMWMESSSYIFNS